MKVTLNVENDAELRAYVKEMIKGQVLSIVREEFISIIREELDRKIKGTNGHKFDMMQKDAIKAAISEILYKEHNVGAWHIDFVRPIVSDIVNKQIAGNDWKSIVEALAKEKIRNLIS